MTFDEFVQHVAAQWQEHETGVWRRGWRRGQTHINLLWDVRKDLHAKVLASEDDPFYDDAKLPGFLAWLERNWDE